MDSRPKNSLGKNLSESVRRLFKEFRVIRRILAHPRAPWHAKAVAGCAVLYIVSPIQLIPNFIPVIGQMDDVVVVVLALRYLRRFVPQDVLDQCEDSTSPPPAVTRPVGPASDAFPHSSS